MGKILEGGWGWVACGITAIALLPVCAPEVERPPDIILVTVDTLRADRLSPYGHTDVATPAIQQLANDGILFENAFCDVTWTIPSMASVFTGSYATSHGVRSIHDSLSEDALTLAEHLKPAGYATAAIVGSVPLDHRFGFSQGFDSYDDEMSRPFDKTADVADGRPRWFTENLATAGYRPDDEVADRALAWLASAPDEPFFLWVHFFGPHEKPERVPNSKDKLARLLLVTDQKTYMKDVAFMDQQVGRLLDALRDDPRTRAAVVVFHSDHGQTFDEHVPPGHGFDVYDTTARVPLILRLPGDRRAGERVSRLVRNVDIFATLSALAGRPTPSGIESRDLLGPDEDGRSGGEHVYLETFRGTGSPYAEPLLLDGRSWRVGSSLRGVRTDRWKLIVREPALTHASGESPLPAHYLARTSSLELYDLSADPVERRSLIDPSEEERDPEQSEVVERLMKLLATYHRDASDAARPIDHDERTLEQLRSLGYVD